MPTITGLTTDDTTTPLQLLPWRTTQEAGTVVHDIQGAPSPWVSLGPGRTRNGTLEALYDSEADAEGARVLLSGSELFEITYEDRPSLEFTFTVSGRIDVELQQVRKFWVVRFEYREVA